MGLEHRQASRITCDAHGCDATCPPEGQSPEWWVQDTPQESELVAMNIAGDIDHIVGTLEGASEVLLGPHGPTVQARQIGELCEELAARLRRIAAGIRGASE